MLRMVAGVAREMAISTASGCVAAITARRSRRVPRTLTPWIRWPVLLASSSMNPTGAYSCSGFVRMARTIVSPASPAP